MISLLGRTVVLVGLAACAIGFVTGMFAGARKSADATRLTRIMAYVFGASLTAAALLMEYALITHDFSVSYVAQVGSRASPLWVTIVSLWSSLEGSILLWAFVLGVFTAAFAWKTRDRFPEHTPWALGITLGVGTFFSFLVAGLANPFAPMSPIPTDGPGPNPLLQNHILMVIHPPSLYLGFVGMAVPFGMATAALLAGKLDAAWMRALRRWTLVPWTFLSVGIVLGGWWSYEVLGWGGYWAWDPVENASFLPWLTCTAFLHSAMVMEHKDHLKGWTLSLLLATFLLTILGTFMTRSGVFNSVHAFTQTPIGPVFLVFLGICLVFSVLLLAARVDKLVPPDEGMAGQFSKESAFLANNLLFCAFTFTVLLGTVYPMLNEVITGEQISVGEPYFNRMSVPIAIAIVFMMGVGPALPWGRASTALLRDRLGPPTVAAVGTAVLCYGFGLHNVPSVACFAVSAFAAAVHVREFWEPARARAAKTGEALPVALIGITTRARRRFGGYIVHFGVITVAVAVAASSAYRSNDHLTIVEGQSAKAGAYTLTFLGTRTEKEPHRTAEIARIGVARNGTDLGVLEPRLNNYTRMGQPIGTPAVRSVPREDLYLSLIKLTPEAKLVSLDAIIQPLVWWIWVGGGIMVLGTVIAIWPNRARAEATASVAAPIAAAAPPPNPSLEGRA